MTTVYQAPYDLTDEQVSAPDTPTFLLPICTTPERLAKMLGALIEGGMVLGYGQIDDYNVDFFEALSKLTTCDDEPTPVEPTEPIIQIIKQFVAQFDDSCEDDDCEDDMACLKPVKMNGAWYLPVDCGCEDSLFLPLGNPVALDSNGDPIGVNDGGEFGGGFSDGGGGAGGSWDGTVSSGNASCYAEQAVAYLLARAESFLYAMIDYNSLGTAVQTPFTSTFINWQNTFAAILFGNSGLSYIRTLSKSAVSAMLADASLISALEAGWTFTGSVNKNQLKNWIAQNTPITVNGLSASTILITWLDFSLVVGYNNDLITLAAQCESGNTVPTLPFSFEWGVEYDFEIDTQTWLVSGSTNAVYDAGVGWRQNLSGDKTIEIRHPEPQYVTGITIYLSREFSGDVNEITFRNSSLGAAVVTEVQTGEILTVPVDYNFGSTFAIGIEESTLATSVDNMWITKVVVYGTGTVPTGGTVIF